MSLIHTSCCPCTWTDNLALKIADATALCGAPPGLLRAHIYHDLLNAKYPTSRPVIIREELYRWNDFYKNEFLRIYSPNAPIRDRWLRERELISRAIQHNWNFRPPSCCDCHASSRLSYTTDEAAAAIGVSISTIRELIRNSYLIARYPTSRPIVEASSLREFLISCRDEPR